MASQAKAISTRKLRMGMVGGGEGAFIGAVHRRGALMDGQIELVAGAFDIDPAKGKKYGVESLYLDPSRCYGTYAEMASAEAKLPTDRRIDFVSIVTPNNLHFPVAKAFLEAGFNVVCEKPMTVSLKQARDLQKVVTKTGRVFVLTHNYTGYPMVKQARVMVAAGEIGTVKKVIVEYPQGWLLKRIELEGQPQALWRTDPKQAGPAGCLGDIGSHCANLAYYITGLEIKELCADLTTFAPGRAVDDDVNVLLHFAGGARGILHASQISAGEENNLKIRVYGEKASLFWEQERPNCLYVASNDGPTRVFSRGQGYLADIAKLACRVPPGHPEAYIESFGNTYLGAVASIREAGGGKKQKLRMDHQGVDDGVRAMAFIETVIESAGSTAKWTKFKKF